MRWPEEKGKGTGKGKGSWLDEVLAWLLVFFFYYYFINFCVFD
jgi:hypothetical protein